MQCTVCDPCSDKHGCVLIRSLDMSTFTLHTIENCTTMYYCNVSELISEIEQSIFPSPPLLKQVCFRFAW